VDFGENFLLDLCPYLTRSDGNFGQSYASELFGMATSIFITQIIN